MCCHTPQTGNDKIEAASARLVNAVVRELQEIIYARRRGRAERHLNTGEEMKTAGIPFWFFFFSFSRYVLDVFPHRNRTRVRGPHSLRTFPFCSPRCSKSQSPPPTLFAIHPLHPPHPSSAPITVSSHLLLPRRRRLFHSCLAISFLFFFCSVASSLLFETPVADPSGCYESALPLVSHSE